MTPKVSPPLLHELVSVTVVLAPGAGFKLTCTALPAGAFHFESVMSVFMTASAGLLTQLRQATEIVVETFEGETRPNVLPVSPEPVQGCPVQLPVVPPQVLAVRFTVSVKVTNCPDPAGRLILTTLGPDSPRHSKRARQSLGWTWASR